MKDPTNNSYEGGATFAQTGIGVDESGGPATDYSLYFNIPVVSDDHKSGLSLFGFTRQREMFDANNDSFSELAPLENLTFGVRAFHSFSSKDRLGFDVIAINEERNGGNKQDYPLHERDIAEALTYRMKVAGVTYERYFRNYDMLSLYASGQFLNRGSYDGANQSLKDYGNSRDRSFNMGLHYKAVFRKSSLVWGVENTSEFLLDKKLGYPEVIKPTKTKLQKMGMWSVPA